MISNDLFDDRKIPNPMSLLDTDWVPIPPDRRQFGLEIVVHRDASIARFGAPNRKESVIMCARSCDGTPAVPAAGSTLPILE
jgi:hypothetical protein